MAAVLLFEESFGSLDRPLELGRASRSSHECILARNLPRIRLCEFLLQVAAQRRINSRIQSDQGLDF
jgi:hypothetical protein